MKKILLLLLIVISTVSYGQKKWEVSIGPSLFAPITNTIDWDNKAWGQRVQIAHHSNHKDFYYTLLLGLQQTKNKEVQTPIIPNVKWRATKNIHIGFGTGVVFFSNDGARFTISPSISYVNKRWTLEQSLFRTTNFVSNLDGTHYNNLGLTLLYRL
jgi:hypothetical protein